MITFVRISRRGREVPFNDPASFVCHFEMIGPEETKIMCGIVGYVGKHSAKSFLLEGLRRLEYRGYDSAGTALANGTPTLLRTRSVGRIKELVKKHRDTPESAHAGIGHTRWATHGPATEENAHPHLGGQSSGELGMVCLAHNGVIENYQELKNRLIAQGYEFTSATDTEVIAHLIADCVKNSTDPVVGAEGDEPYSHLVLAVKRALAQLRGTYGLVVMFPEYPDVIIAARLGSPLVVGVGDHEHFIASDASPLVGYTDRIVYLADHQVAVVTADNVWVSHRDQGPIQIDVKRVELETGSVEKNGYDHFMLKEIFEQPESLRNTMRGRLSDDDATAIFGGLNLTPQELRKVRRIVLTACGTSWHSALVGEYLFEELAQIPVEVEYASELRYRNPPMDDRTLVFAITQSGETADTLAALREMKRMGHPALGICNVVGSSIAQESDGGIYLHAGPEIGVASTKAYTSQCLALTMLALQFGRMRHISYDSGREMIDQIRRVPELIEESLKSNEFIPAIAEKYKECNNFLYLGRHYNFPTALEGALKLKEISYIHAEGYPAAEMKHGPIALVDENTPSVFVMPRGFIYDKVMSNLEEIKARGGPVIAIAEEGDERVAEIADDVIYMPRAAEYLQPMIATIPLQLLAYHIAVFRGCDVDKPRNLAKSVTVE